MDPRNFCDGKPGVGVSETALTRLVSSQYRRPLRLTSVPTLWKTTYFLITLDPNNSLRELRCSDRRLHSDERAPFPWYFRRPLSNKFLLFNSSTVQRSVENPVYSKTTSKEVEKEVGPKQAPVDSESNGVKNSKTSPYRSPPNALVLGRVRLSLRPSPPHMIFLPSIVVNNFEKNLLPGTSGGLFDLPGQ